MPRYIGGLTAYHPVQPRVDMTPDWMRSLLPAGGKVSLTVHGPPNAAAAAPQPAAQGVAATAQPMSSPTAFVTGGAVSEPPRTAVGAARVVGGTASAAAPATNVAGTPSTNGGILNDPHGPGHPIPGGPGSKPVPPPPGKNQWTNPYTGKMETIPGMNAQGIITDPNAFWAYYSKYPSGSLDNLVKNQHTYWIPPDYNAIVNSQEGYINGMASINNTRWQQALDYGDPVLAEQLLGRKLTPAERTAIANNPNSAIQKRLLALRQAVYGGNAAAASHGAWSSGARNQDLANASDEDVRQQLADEMGFRRSEGGQDEAARQLFSDTKDKYISDHAGEAHDESTANEHAYTVTHLVITKANNAAHTAITNSAKWKTESDLRNGIAAIDKFLKESGKLLDPSTLAALNKARHDARVRLEPFLHHSTTVIVHTKPTKVG